MDIVQIIDDVTEWAQANICDKVQLKVPPENDADAVDENYEYELVTPQGQVPYPVALRSLCRGGRPPRRQRRQHRHPDHVVDLGSWHP